MESTEKSLIYVFRSSIAESMPQPGGDWYFIVEGINCRFYIRHDVTILDPALRPGDRVKITITMEPAHDSSKA